MNLVSCLYGWTTDDEASLFLSRGRHPKLPSHIRALRAGRVGIDTSPDVYVPIAGLTLLARGRYDAGRDQPSPASSHVYIVYMLAGDGRDPGIVIAEQHATGDTFYLLDGAEQVQLWLRLKAVLSPEEVWELANAITGTYHFSGAVERESLKRAFARDSHAPVHEDPKGDSRAEHVDPCNDCGAPWRACLPCIRPKGHLGFHSDVTGCWWR